MPKMNKRMKAASYMSNFESLFRCPVCHAPMQIMNLKSLVCANNHPFDIAKQGYVNLALKQAKTKYDKKLFQARKEMMQENQFFHPLLEKIAECIVNYSNNNLDRFTFLDMGCGEGSHLSTICETIQSQTEKNIAGVGIDLSKEGIVEATKQNRNFIWAVADLANAPFQDRQFDVIFNILSPSNYEGFERLLKTGGLLIKVIPQSDYLKELREAFLDKEHAKTYSNDKTVNHFQKHFQMKDQTRITYTVTLSQEMMESLLHMTPLTWNVSEEKIRDYLNGRNETEVTVDLDIVIGVK